MRWLVVACCYFAMATSVLASEVRDGSPAALVLDQDDWPCDDRYRAELEAGMFWPRTALLDRAGPWRDAPDLKALVETVASDGRTELAVQRLDQFARNLRATGAQKDRKLATIFQGLVEEMNFYRDIILYGIMQSVAKAQLVTGIAAVAEPGPSNTRSRHFWAARAEDDARDDAHFLCRRLIALEEKLGAMANSLARHLTPSSR